MVWLHARKCTLVSLDSLGAPATQLPRRISRARVRCRIRQASRACFCSCSCSRPPCRRDGSSANSFDTVDRRGVCPRNAQRATPWESVGATSTRPATAHPPTAWLCRPCDGCRQDLAGPPRQAVSEATTLDAILTGPLPLGSLPWSPCMPVHTSTRWERHQDAKTPELKRSLTVQCCAACRGYTSQGRIGSPLSHFGAADAERLDWSSCRFRSANPPQPHNAVLRPTNLVFSRFEI